MTPKVCYILVLLFKEILGHRKLNERLVNSQILRLDLKEGFKSDYISKTEHYDDDSEINTKSLDVLLNYLMAKSNNGSRTLKEVRFFPALLLPYIDIHELLYPLSLGVHFLNYCFSCFKGLNLFAVVAFWKKLVLLKNFTNWAEEAIGQSFVSVGMVSLSWKKKLLKRTI